MKEQFIWKNFRDKTRQLITLINAILGEYAALGFDLSVRQVFYQLVARGHLPNTESAWGKVINIVSEGRLAGLIDWDMIVDRGRRTIFAPHWRDPSEILDAAAESFRIDKWEDQSRHIEVMVEKQALEGVLTPVCRDLDVRLTANKGYSSQSLMYRIGKRLEYKIDQDKEIWILYLGDHDPSGLDMDRDIVERLEMFSNGRLAVRRLALLMEQIEELNPPENPAKLSDSRAAGYIAEFGYSSWELDAVEPTELARLVREAVTSLRDEDLWLEAVAREEAMRLQLENLADDQREMWENDDEN